jgi:hypothetical protein
MRLANPSGDRRRRGTVVPHDRAHQHLPAARHAARGGDAARRARAPAPGGSGWPAAGGSGGWPAAGGGCCGGGRDAREPRAPSRAGSWRGPPPARTAGCRSTASSASMGDETRMSDFEDLTARLLAFRDARDWAQFHTAKDLAASISIEAAELLEELQWVEGAAAEREARERADAIAAELAGSPGSGRAGARTEDGRWSAASHQANFLCACAEATDEGDPTLLHGEGGDQAGLRHDARHDGEVAGHPYGCLHRPTGRQAS